MAKSRFSSTPAADVEVLAIGCKLASLPGAWNAENARREAINNERAAANIELAKKEQPLLPMLDPVDDVHRANAVNAAIAPIAKRKRRRGESGWNPATPELMSAIESDLSFARACFDDLRPQGSLATKRHASLPRTRLEILERDYLTNMRGRVGIYQSPDGPILRYAPLHTGVASVVGHAVAIALDARYEARERIGVCKFCGTYFIDDRTGSGKFRTEFCQQKHADAFKQRARRKRQKSKPRAKPVSTAPRRNRGTTGDDR